MLVMKNNITKLLKENLIEESQNLPIWFAVSYLAGIFIFFTYYPEIPLYVIYLGGTLFFISYALIYYRKINYSFKLIIIIFSAVYLGLLVSYVKTVITKPVTLNKKIQNTHIKGKILSIKPTTFGTQIILEELKIEKLKQSETPNKIRINLQKNTNINSINNIIVQNSSSSNTLRNSDIISLKANLSPLPNKLVPNGYDFKFRAYFQKIGAIGNVRSSILKHEHNNNYIIDTLSFVKKYIQGNIIKKLGKKTGNFVLGIFLGETGGIAKQTLQKMRVSGVSHIFCVSGLHLSIVAMLFYISTRILLNLSDYISYKFDIKKIAAIIAIFSSFIYLAIIGFQTAATRAFIMTSILLYSVLISAQPHPMRSLAVACIIILTLNPQEAVNPSFQLSFTAVSSLLAGFEYLINNSDFLKSSNSLFHKVKLYFLSNIYSSVVVSLATAPIVMYHFYTFSSYTIISNLLVIPIVTIIIIPIGILAIFLSIFYEVNFLYQILDVSIRLIITAIEYIVNISYSSINTGFVYNSSIIFYFIGFCLFCFMKTNLRYIGLIFISLFIIIHFYSQKPDILIIPKEKIISIKDDDKVVIYGKANNFSKKLISSWFGVGKVLHNKKIKKTMIIDQHKMGIDFYNNSLEIFDKKFPLEETTLIFLQSREVKINQC